VVITKIRDINVKPVGFSRLNPAFVNIVGLLRKNLLDFVSKLP
jgi:hypothetical protein